MTIGHPTGSERRTAILRASDVADMLRVPVSTVHDWARSGMLPSRKRGKHRLFILGEVEDWILADDSPDNHRRRV